MSIKKLKILFFGNPGYGGEIFDELLKHDVEIIGAFHETNNNFFKFKNFLKNIFFNFKKILKNIPKIITSNKIQKKLESFFDEKFLITKFDKNIIDSSKKRGIKLFDASQLYQKKCLNEISKLDIDIVLVCTFSFLIPKQILSTAKIAAINFHPSLLPKYRGAIPEICVIYNGEKKTGISFHLMTEKFDKGNLILQRKLDVQDNDTTVSLKKKLSSHARDSLKDLFTIIRLRNLKGEIQKEAEASYCKLERNSNFIYRDLTVEKIKNIINAYHGDIYEPYCKINNKKIYILSYSSINGFSYECRDGKILFDVVRYKNKIYRNIEIKKILKIN